MTSEILTAVIVAVLSSKLWDFLAARFKRKDEREDKQEVGYLYYAPYGISAGANSANKTFIKYNFDYIYN